MCAPLPMSSKDGIRLKIKSSAKLSDRYHMLQTTAGRHQHQPIDFMYHVVSLRDLVGQRQTSSCRAMSRIGINGNVPAVVFKAKDCSRKVAVSFLAKYQQDCPHGNCQLCFTYCGQHFAPIRWNLAWKRRPIIQLFTALNVSNPVSIAYVTTVSRSYINKYEHARNRRHRASMPRSSRARRRTRRGNGEEVSPSLPSWPQCLGERRARGTYFTEFSVIILQWLYTARPCNYGHSVATRKKIVPTANETLYPVSFRPTFFNLAATTKTNVRIHVKWRFADDAETETSGNRRHSVSWNK